VASTEARASKIGFTMLGFVLTLLIGYSLP
jgi:hypothetical protein